MSIKNKSILKAKKMLEKMLDDIEIECWICKKWVKEKKMSLALYSGGMVHICKFCESKLEEPKMYDKKKKGGKKS